MINSIQRINEIILQKLSIYLNETPNAVTADMMHRFIVQTGMPEQSAYRYLLAAELDIDIEKNRQWFEKDFSQMIHCLETDAYNHDPYRQNIHLDSCSLEKWQLKKETLQPYEAFVFDDFRYGTDGQLYPQIGCFSSPFVFDAVLQDGREWMSITPNEINTMRPVIEESCGNVLTYGLGLGYFAYSCSIRPEVSSVTVVEKDPAVIELFGREILPQFEQKNKIRLIEEDAFAYASACKDEYDLTFADLWHDVQDGIPCYRELKKLEKGKTRYWIEKTMQYYMKSSE